MKSSAILRVYADTSVIGGCHDPEFARESQQLLEMVRRGRIILLISQVVLDELASAPPEVQSLLNSLPREHIEYVELTSEVSALADACLKAGIVGRR
jgi:hypothetical protein